MIMHARSTLSAAAAAVFACALSNTGAAASTLYERLGGYDAIQAVVDQTITNVAADQRINKFFAHADIPRLRRNLADQICVATGGWCIY
jgi:hemoglobin